MIKTVLVAILLVACTYADVYMHNPRGSNCRLNEANANRNNGARLFDSQNNAKGGYCVGPAMSYYEGSLLTIEWTNQHGCGSNPKLYCNMVIQYMCGSKGAPALSLIRDGQTTDTIPANEAGATATNENGDYEFGMHEPLSWYQACTTRQRNKGLWIADREEEGNLVDGRNEARFTRQNNNGNRNGLECAEERDYYPYWVATPWRDVAVLTWDTDWCDFYKSESQNVKERYWCIDEEGNQAEPNNEADCSTTDGLTWARQEPWNIPAPDCVQAPWSRHNHLGSGLDGFANTYNWTLPTQDEEECIAGDDCNCILRIRYNISTLDLGENGNRPDAGFIDWTSNGANSPIYDDEIKEQDGLPHELALDTTQYGRTFEDRTHVFHIKPRPDGVASTQRIFNLNVRGKRGNIVQAYPSVEYDFVPSYLYARQGDMIHFQWTGCDTNPAGNAGEGTAQTDRNNIVQLECMGCTHPARDEWLRENKPLFEDPELRKRMAMLDQTDCLSQEELLAKNDNNQNDAEQDVQNCMKLNAASQYFDGGLVRMNLTGDFYYVSTRNNNFTNRGQKGAIHIVPLLPTWAIVVVVIGAIFFVLSGAVAGMMFYAKSHPHSGMAEMMSKI